MIHGIRCTACSALAWGALAMGCAPATPDPAQLSTVDSLITTTAAALFTLNELDAGRYHRLDSTYEATSSVFRARFTDTLDRNSARVLGDQYLLLRGARRLGADHLRVANDLRSTSERLHALRNDLAQGAIAPEKALDLIGRESTQHAALTDEVYLVIANYRAVQQAWDRRDTVEQLLSLSALPVQP